MAWQSLPQKKETLINKLKIGRARLKHIPRSKDLKQIRRHIQKPLFNSNL